MLSPCAPPNDVLRTKSYQCEPILRQGWDDDDSALDKSKVARGNVVSRPNVSTRRLHQRPPPRNN